MLPGFWHHRALLAPARFGHGSATTDLLRTVEHAAVWRLMWHLPAIVLVGLALVAFLVLRHRTG